MAKKEMKELPMLVVTSKVKDYIKDEANDDSFRMAGDFPEALSEVVCVLIKRAIARAQGRGGKTVSPNDV